MDPAANVFYGPHRVQSSGTVSIPRELLRELGLQAGTDQAHWVLNPDLPGTLVLIPDSLLAGGGVGHGLVRVWRAHRTQQVEERLAAPNSVENGLRLHPSHGRSVPPGQPVQAARPDDGRGGAAPVDCPRPPPCPP
ncbi:MAG: AbrB/MazE/SpoVT family DNA-binding domain-containing protein [Actinobacteria bacterium]|nr:AbrB/MazE/SpoVT family DNA-binding domain-containing protein [Actinomycetota bacterium]